MRSILRNAGITSIVVLITWSWLPKELCYAIELANLADICKAMEDSIISISAEYEWNDAPPMKPEQIIGKNILITKGPDKHTLIADSPFFERFIYTREGTFMDERGKCHDEQMKTSYSKGITKHFQESSFPADGNKPAEKFLDGKICQRRPADPTINRTPIGFSVLRLLYEEGATLSDLLKRSDLAEITNEPETVNGFKSIRVDLLIEKIRRPYIRVYFAIDYGYTPIRYSFMRKAGTEEACVVDVNSLQHVANGLWFPSSGSIRLPGKDRVEQYRATKPILLNHIFKEEIFDIGKFPPGTQVDDRISGKEYVVKPTQEQLDETLPAKN